MKITNPYAGATSLGRIQTNLPSDVFNRWFRGYFAGDNGIRAALLSNLFAALDKAVLELNLPPVYDLSNESAIAAVLARCNFDPRPPVSAPESRPTKGHDAGGTPKVRARNKKTSIQSADANGES